MLNTLRRNSTFIGLMNKSKVGQSMNTLEFE